MDLFGDEPPEDDFNDIDEAEAEESIDAAESFTHPRLMNFSLGHSDIEKTLLDLYNDGRLPHAIVFTGPKGIGKATTAYRFARFLLKNGIKDTNQSSMFGDAPAATTLDVTTSDPIVQRIASGGHADLLTVERKFDDAKNRYKDSLDVEEIRRIAPFLRMTSSEGGWRVVLVDDADTMSRNAQNAILKILEEPPKNTVLTLIAHRAGALIPTIRSRARFMNFAPLDNAAMTELLRRKNLSTREIETLTQLAEGSIGKALQYAENGAAEILAGLSQTLQNNSINWLEIHKLADTLSGPGSDTPYETFQEILLWILKQNTRAIARGQQPANPTHLLKNSSLEEMLKICENLESHFNRSDFANLDRKQTVLGAFSLLAA